MELSRAGMAFLRSPTSRLSSVLASTTSVCRPVPLARFPPSAQFLHRQFSALPRRLQDEQSRPDYPQQKDESTQEDVSKKLETILDPAANQTGSQGRTSRFKTPFAQQLNRDPRAPHPEKTTSAEETAKAFGEEFMKPRAQNLETLGRSGLSTQRMKLPIHERTTAAKYGINKLQEATPAPIKLDAYTGRSIALNTGRGIDLGRGLRSLDMLLTRNGVRKDLNRQRFHERPGLKRKRLKSERWRKRFKKGFQHIVSRVVALRKQGW